MARMSIDDKFLRDPRVVILSKRLGWDVRQTRGALLEVWAVAYDRETALLSKEEVDTITGLDGFSSHLIASCLATQTEHGLRISGVTERIEFLIRQRAHGQMGGRASAISRASTKALKGSGGDPEGSSQPPSSLPSSSSSSSSSASASASASAPDLSQKKNMSASADESQPLGSKNRKNGKSAVTESERAIATDVLSRLGKHAGVKFRGSTAHVSLIAKRLREGLTHWDLRTVVAYCAYKLGWANDDDMRKYLRPETLFGPTTIHRYLDAARTAYPETAWNSRETRLDAFSAGGGSQAAVNCQTSIVPPVEQAECSTTGDEDWRMDENAGEWSEK